MAREKIKIPMNFDDPGVRQNAAKACYQARGPCVFAITPVRPTRSLRQNAYYFGVICSMFCDFMKRHGSEDANLEFCHAVLKHKWLREEVIIPETGEIVARTRSTTELSTGEFTDYIENCRMWLAEMRIDTPDPDPDWAAKREAVRT